MTKTRRLGNKLLRALVNQLFGTRYTDLCYGYNAFWARHLDTLALDCSGFEIEALMNIRAATGGLVVQEVPSFEHRRIHGVSNLKIVMDGRRIVKVILREWLASRRARRGKAQIPLASDLQSSDVRVHSDSSSATLVRKSASAVDSFEGLLEVVGDGVDGGDGVRADLDLDGAVAAGRTDEFAD